MISTEVFGSSAVRDAEPALFSALKQLRRDLGDDI
jgi:DNA-binding winged helix-turn-helix (wHTH) protein